MFCTLVVIVVCKFTLTFLLFSRCDNGKSLLIVNPQLLTHQVFPLYFKHSNFLSFVRQLNFYGFKKIKLPQYYTAVAGAAASSSSSSSTTSDYSKQRKKSSGRNRTDDPTSETTVPPATTNNTNNKPWKFRHVHFRQGRSDLLCKIRKQQLQFKQQRSPLTPYDTAAEEDDAGDEGEEEEEEDDNDGGVEMEKSPCCECRSGSGGTAITTTSVAASPFARTESVAVQGMQLQIDTLTRTVASLEQSLAMLQGMIAPLLTASGSEDTTTLRGTTPLPFPCVPYDEKKEIYLGNGSCQCGCAMIESCRSITAANSDTSDCLSPEEHGIMSLKGDKFASMSSHLLSSIAPGLSIKPHIQISPQDMQQRLAATKSKIVYHDEDCLSQCSTSCEPLNIWYESANDKSPAVQSEFAKDHDLDMNDGVKINSNRVDNNGGSGDCDDPYHLLPPWKRPKWSYWEDGSDSSNCPHNAILWKDANTVPSMVNAADHANRRINTRYEDDSEPLMLSQAIIDEEIWACFAGFDHPSHHPSNETTHAAALPGTSQTTHTSNSNELQDIIPTQQSSNTNSTSSLGSEARRSGYYLYGDGRSAAPQA